MSELSALHFPELRASLGALDALVTYEELVEVTEHLRARIPERLKCALDTLHDSVACLSGSIKTNAAALSKYAGAPSDKTLADVVWARAAVEGALDEVLNDLESAQTQLRAFQTRLHGRWVPVIALMAAQVSEARARIEVDWVTANEIDIGSIHESFTRQFAAAISST